MVFLFVGDLVLTVVVVASFRVFNALAIVFFYERGVVEQLEAIVREVVGMEVKGASGGGVNGDCDVLLIG